MLLYCVIFVVTVRIGFSSIRTLDCELKKRQLDQNGSDIIQEMFQFFFKPEVETGSLVELSIRVNL